MNPEETTASNELQSTFYFPSSSMKMTEQYWTLISDYKQVVDLFFFLVHLADRVDKVSVVAAKALLNVVPDEERVAYQKVLDNPDRASSHLREYAYLNSKNLTLNIVDAFLWYLSAVLQAAMKRRPQMVKSKEKIEIEAVFDFRNKKELVNFLIDRKINSLSYGGIRGLKEFVRDSLGVDLFSNSRAEQLVQVFVEVRNIQIHNRGIVNSTFLRRIKDQRDFTFKEGKRVYLDLDELVKLSRLCMETALGFDEQVAKKFGIRTKRLVTWRSTVKK